MIISIIVGVIVTMVAVTLENHFNGGRLFAVKDTEDGHTVRALSEVDYVGWIKALALGVVAFLGLYNIYTVKKPWFAVIVCILMLAADVFLVWWWNDGGDTLKEILIFAIIAVVMYFLFRGNAYIVSVLWDNAFLTKLVTLLPLIGLIGLIGFAVSNTFFYYRNNRDVIEDTDDVDEQARKNAAAERHLAFGWAARILAVIITIIVIITTFTACSSPNQNQNQNGQSNPSGTWYKFYNTELQHDNDGSNNFDFGPNPYHKSWTAKDYDADFRKTLKNDPAIAAADIAWFDANLGTRYLGEFYESCKKDWAKTINAAKVSWMNNQMEYYQILDAFFAFLDTGVPEATVNDDLDDQMYMNPYTPDGVPDVIVMETLDHHGTFLTYRFQIKGSSTTTGDKPITVSYRINCKYQPTNVEKVMGIKPQSKPTGSTGSGGSNPSPSPGYNPSPSPSPTTSPSPGPSPSPTTSPSPGPSPTTSPSPSPSPTTEPSPSPTTTPTPTTKPKDKSKGTQGDVVGPDDNPGPGPNTNNGVGSTTAPADQPDNSNHYNSYDEYCEKMDELEQTNKDQRTGSDSNTPSYDGGSNTNVDNNADNGTGYGGIDTPTPVSDPARTSDGNPISNTPDNPAGAWGGLPD